VNSKPADPTAAASALATICQGESTTLSLSGGGGGTGEVIAWYTGSCGGTLIGTGNGFSVSPAVTTTYYGRYETGAPCNFNSACASVTITVNTAPLFTVCPAGPIALNTPAGSCTATTTYTLTATGIPEPELSYEFTGATAGSGSGTGSGSAFNVGTTNVKVTASNSCGTDICEFTVTVTDNINPEITCPGNINESAADGSCTKEIAVTNPTYGDNCSVAHLTWSMTGVTTASSPATGIHTIGTYTFNSGITTINYTVTDASGNTANCSFTVTVTDTTPPVIANCPGEIIFYTGAGRLTCNQVATWTEPSATDNCTLPGNITWTKSHLPNTTFPVGSTTVTYTARDAANNTSACTFTVTVIDNTPPAFTPPIAYTGYANSTNCALPSLLPSITGSPNPASMTDNCSSQAYLATTVSYSDDPEVTGSCPGSRTITRTWTITDAAGNAATRTQLITILDNTPPVITVPANISISCTASTHPDNTGWATATDNCTPSANIVLTWEDVVTPGTCAGRSTIARTWTATDLCGNVREAVNKQTINITDNTPPTLISVNHRTVQCPADIPLPNPADIVVSDNCGNVTMEVSTEVSNELQGKPGYCPTSVTRTWRVCDDCSNCIEVVQTITILSECECKQCATQLSHYWVDMMGNPSGHVILKDLQRLDRCCDYNKDDCISFNVRLDPHAVGVEVLIDGATPTPHDWRMDCNTISMVNGIVCIPGGEYHLFTFCKPGANKNSYSFRSLRGVVVSDDVLARVDCTGQLEATGIVSNPVWTSISPGPEGMYDHYLSNRNITNPVFLAYETPTIPVPASVTYRICGNIGSTYCTAAGISCAEVTVTIADAIEIDLNINPGLICAGKIPVITPDIYPASVTYVLDWYAGYDATGTPICSNCPSFTPPGEGPYSIKVTDVREGIPCSTKLYNFDIVYDHTGPTMQAPPSPLEIECNDPAAPQLITNWLQTASATYTNAQGNVVTFVPDNNFTGISMHCNNVLTIIFSALDHCSNENSITSTITVRDTKSPIWMTNPGALDRTVECGNETALLAAQALFPLAFDECEAGLVPVKTSGPYPSADCLDGTTIINTWIVTDACGNTSEVYTQTITITDKTPPVITCPSAASNFADNNVCHITDLVLQAPVASDNCGVPAVTWVKSGATEGSGTGTVTGPFNVGVTTVTYTATDGCGLTATCTQEVTIVDSQPPTITCPGNVTVTVLLPECEMEVLTIPAPVITENCQNLGITLTWTKSGATSGTGTGDVNGSVFHTGVTTVTYLISDAAGNTDQCSFTVTVNDQIPPTILTCDNTPVFAVTDEGECETYITLIPPTAEDPCGESFIITHDSLDGISEENASGNYPPGIHVVTWSVTDESGNASYCTVTITVTDNQPPTISCPGFTEDLITDGGCTRIGENISDPVIDDNCQVETLTWNLEGATTGSSQATGINYVSTALFNVGITTVTYLVTDVNGLTASCSFDVWIKNLDAPRLSTECPDDVTQAVDEEECFATVTVPAPEIDNPCNEAFTMVNDYTERTSDSDASGIYQIGETIVTWTITDASGNITTCIQTITIYDDQDPELECPDNISVFADYGQQYANSVQTFPPDVVEDNCQNAVLTWIMTPPTDFTGEYLPGQLAGTGVFPEYERFYVGLTVIYYTLTDIGGNSVTCSFTITVEAAPDIECPDSIRIDNNAGLCTATTDPGVPVLLSGGQPITWSWTIEYADGTIETIPVPFVGSPGNPGPPPIGERDFQVGINRITWTAYNSAGSDQCTQIVEVIDVEEPSLIPPPDTFEDCVENLIMAVYNNSTDPGNNVDYNPDYPGNRDYYLFRQGSNVLDLDMDNYQDNCCQTTDSYAINWRIDFDGTQGPESVSGTGQPSLYGTDINLWGDGINFQDRNHTIIYWITDCHGNISDAIPRTITIKPRPQIIKY
jgi:hypothetical protein